MELPNEKVQEIVRRLQNARINLLQKQPFYALLLMDMKFAIDKNCDNSYTDGERIVFNPDFINTIDDEELEFVLMHNVLHVALLHPFRVQADYDLEIFDRACDIVVNSNILYGFGYKDLSKITLKRYGVMPHLTPSGKEGYKLTLEQIYDELMQEKDKSSQSKKNAGKKMALNILSKKSEESKQGSDDSGKCANDTKEGKYESLEELKAAMLAKNKAISNSLKTSNAQSLKSNTENTSTNESPDDHSYWEGDNEDGSGKDYWTGRLISAAEALSSMGGKERGAMPLAAERLIQELKEPKLDWRTILNDFVQEEICDYSFAPPDKRMEDCPFFLPDFNEKDETAKNLLFMVDTSGSMSDEAITECYGEIYGAIQQFNGKLQGKIGFFDAAVVEPISFEEESELKIIRPKGGGGTSFYAVFHYVKEKMQDELPVSIIILTDGYAPFPDIEDTQDIPVLWIINNKDVNPPWGKIARLVSENT